jgi:hypothetical protein
MLKANFSLIIENQGEIREEEEFYPPKLKSGG